MKSPEQQKRDEDWSLLSGQVVGGENMKSEVDSLAEFDAEPWPLIDVLRRLANAADTLLVKYDYDQHGHEEIATCRDYARRFADRLEALKGAK